MCILYLIIEQEGGMASHNYYTENTPPIFVFRQFALKTVKFRIFI
jgi:hypothetical protein